MTKRIVLCFCLLNFIFMSLVSANPPEITAKSAILIEASTGRVVYEKNPDERMMPASMTKMITAIIAIEKYKMTDEIRISRNAAETEDEAMPLAANDIITMENLLRALMLESDNGSAVAIAEYTAGDVKSFAKLMNKKAKEIGCEETNFVTPNGLPDSRHLSTARDMAKIAAYAMRSERFRELVSIKNTNMFWVLPKDKIAPLENTNKLLWTFQGITGIKTGWTSAAGGCLAASAKRKDLELIAIVMNSYDANSRFKEAADLLEYGFSKVRTVKGPSKDELKRTVWIKGGEFHVLPVVPSEDIVYPLLEGDNINRYSLQYNLPKIVSAPVKKGDKVGEIIINYQKSEVGRIDLVATADAYEGFSFLSYFFVGLMYYLGVR